MPKREVNWQPDIYDMAARRAGDPSPAVPRASGRITDLTNRQVVPDESPAVPSASGRISDLKAQRQAAARAAAALPVLDEDDEDLEDEDHLLLDLDDELVEPVGDLEVATVAPAKGRRAPVTATAAQPAKRGDNSGLLGMLLGALVGAGLTLLVTPASGAQLRTRLQGTLPTAKAGQHPDQAPATQGYHGIREGVAQNMPYEMAVEQAAPQTEAEQL